MKQAANACLWTGKNCWLPTHLDRAEPACPPNDNDLHEKEERKSRDIQIALCTEQFHVGHHFSLGVVVQVLRRSLDFAVLPGLPNGICK